MLTIAVANHKGGVGKTATAHTLAAVLAADHGRRVLMVDTDPQASLTQAAGIPDAAGCSLAEVLGGSVPGTLTLGDAIRPLGPGLAIVPADIALAGSELGLISRMGREDVLRRALATVAADYDLALLDCPPSLSLLTINALAAGDGVIVPTQPQAADLRGLALFLATVDQVRRELNPSLDLVGVLVTFFDSRLIHHQEAIEAMDRAGIPLLLTRIGRTVRIAEAAGAGQPVTVFSPNNPQAEAYRDLAQEVEGWLNDRRPR